MSNAQAWATIAQRTRDVLLNAPPPKKKTCVCEANRGLVLFLRSVADEVGGNGNDTWSMSLRRAAKGVAAAPVALRTEEQAARDVQGVGKSTAALCSVFWKVCPPDELDGGAADAAAPPRGRAASSPGGDAPAPRKRKAPAPKGPWEPKYKTANFALLVTLDRLKREGTSTVTKAALIDAAEASRLSADGIKPRAASTNAAAAVGAGKQYTYDGWSGFNKYLASVLPGYGAPLVHTFSNPMQIRLTEEGAALALKLHRAAEARGDCCCGLLPPAGDDDVPSSAVQQRVDEGARLGSGGASPARDTSPVGRAAARAPPAPPPRAAAARPAPRAPPPVDDDCILISSSDDEHAAPPLPPQRAAAPPAAKRARTAPQDADADGGGAAGASEEFAWKAVPSWRLSSLSGDASHGVRLPPLPAGVSFATEYDIVLLVDNREQFQHGATGGRVQGAHEGIARLQQRGVTAELRQLAIGDAVWVARSRRRPGDEYCLDFVCERKRLDDLESSIRDARYKQQKYFLKRCGLHHPMYLLEGEPGAAGAMTGAGVEWRTRAVKTAMLSTEVVDGFQVLRTPDAHGTFDCYWQLTDALRSLYATLPGPPPGGAGAPEALRCPTFGEFMQAVAAVRREAKSVRALWGLMLTQVPGVGGDVAEAVLWEHPTPAALHDAYAAALRAGGRDAARSLLAPLRTSAVKTIGPVLSARIFDWCTQAGGAALL